MPPEVEHVHAVGRRPSRGPCGARRAAASARSPRAGCGSASPSSPTSSWLRPPAGSSSSSSRGPAARARASSTALARAVRELGRLPVRERRRGRRRRAARAALRPRPRVCAPTSTCSSTVIDSNSSTFWNVRAIPRRTTRCGGVRSRLSPSNAISPVVGLVEARDQVEERRLAGAVRADQADDLALARRRASRRRRRRPRRTAASRARPRAGPRAGS